MLSLFLSGVLASTHTHSPSFPLLQQIFFSFSFTAIVEEEPPTETVSSWHLGSHIAPSVLLLPAPIHKRDLHPRHHSCRWRCLQFTAKSCLRTPRQANNHEYDLVFKVLCVNKPGLSVFSRLMNLFFCPVEQEGLQASVSVCEAALMPLQAALQSGLRLQCQGRHQVSRRLRLKKHNKINGFST